MIKQPIIILLFSTLFFSCKKEPAVNNSELLGDTYIRHQFKDRLSKVQLMSRLISFYPNADSLIQPLYDVIVYRIFYKTHDYQNNEITASGLVYVPELKNYFAPVVCYQHGTCIQKQEVPSIAADAGYYVPFIIASETGAIVCAADYIGLGLSEGVHHYYEPNEEADAVLDMLGSVQKLLNKTAQNKTFDYNVFLMGYSQGGHATLAAQRKLETRYSTQFKLIASAPMASWFSLENSSQITILKNNVPCDFPAAYAFLINSLLQTQQFVSSGSEIFNPPYDSLANVLFDGTKSTGYINAQYPEVFSSTLKPDFRNQLISNTSNSFIQAAKKYDVINDWVPKAPTRFYHSVGDELAFYDNSEIAYTSFKNKGGNVTLINIGNYSHFEGNIIAIDSVRHWFYPLIKIRPY